MQRHGRDFPAGKRAAWALLAPSGEPRRVGAIAGMARRELCEAQLAEPLPRVGAEPWAFERGCPCPPLGGTGCTRAVGDPARAAALSRYPAESS